MATAAGDRDCRDARLPAVGSAGGGGSRLPRFSSYMRRRRVTYPSVDGGCGGNGGFLPLSEVAAAVVAPDGRPATGGGGGGVSGLQLLLLLDCVETAAAAALHSSAFCFFLSLFRRPLSLRKENRWKNPPSLSPIVFDLADDMATAAGASTWVGRG